MTVAIYERRISGIRPTVVATATSWTEADRIARELSKEPEVDRIITMAGDTQHIYQHGKWIHGSSGWSTR